MKTRLVLYADEGKVLTDGEIYGKIIYIAEGASESDYHEITDSEYKEIVAEEAKKMEELI